MVVNHHGRSAIWAGAEPATPRNGQLELCGEPEAQADGIYLDPPFSSRQRSPVPIEASNSDGFHPVGSVRGNHRTAMLQPDPVPRQQCSVSSRVTEFALGNQWIREPALEHSGWPVRF